ncbi:AAA family ATPase [Uliginosibacterium sp. H3]|uniref:AAA family ATPase n=1 Tax=Uliginosibacterium silvisoli TaxID=3114758 RepID=A0ABU6K4Y4_9RHOO|nr:AAA family ATPase [Uliginosibacterium sp. H3]
MTAMYLDHFGLSEPPFRITPQTAWFFTGAQRGALLDALLYAIAHDEGIIKISGEVGVGKTMLCRMLLERLPADAQVIYIANPSLSPEALLQTVALELGIHDANSLTILRQIEEALIARYAEGRRVVTIIDEAHAMPQESLEQVRLLSNLESANRKLLQIVLFGQTELDELLALREMRSLHDRITQHFALAPMSEAEVAAYVHHRLDAAGYRGPDLFNRQAIRLVTLASRGLTRRINILADKTLMAAFASGTRNVSPRHVRQAATDARYSLPPVKRFGAPALIGIGVACGIAGTVMIGLHLLRQDKPPAPVAAPQASTRPETAASAPIAPIASPLAKSASALVSNPVPLAPQSAPAGLGPVAASLLEESRLHITQSPSGNYFVQIQRVSANDAPSLEAFLQHARASLDPAQLRLYQATIDGRVRYGVIFGDFASAREAAAAIAKMPDWVRALGVYPRQYSALH